MATFADLEAENPNIREQYMAWRQEREENGDDPDDYQAFREHLMALGAPDPGEEPIEDFVSQVS